MMTYIFLIALIGVIGTGAYALRQFFGLGDTQTPFQRAQAGVVMLFTLSAAWMILQVLVDPGVMQHDGGHITRLGYEVFGMARNVGMCWFHLAAGAEAAKQRNKQKMWGAYNGRTIARGSSTSSLARGYKFPR